MFKINKKQKSNEDALVKVDAYRDGSGLTRITLYKGKDKYTMFSYKTLRKFINKNNVDLLALDNSTHNLLNATNISHTMPNQKAVGALLWD